MAPSSVEIHPAYVKEMMKRYEEWLNRCVYGNVDKESFIRLWKILYEMKGEMESYNTVVGDKGRLYNKFTHTLGEVTKLLKKHLGKFLEEYVSMPEILNILQHFAQSV
jgi:hypothetical protein